MMAKHLEEIDHIYDIDNCNNVILGMGRGNKGNISWILLSKTIEDPEHLLLLINGHHPEINTWSDISMRTFARS